MTKQEKIEVPKPDPKLAIWDALGKTDPAHTKGFSRAGGFKGTAVKPMWVIRRLTEQFGPCGEGWGIGEPKFQTVSSEFGETLVYCTVPCWHGSPENILYGVGGDKVVVQRQNGAFHDDEAFKKAFTDAVNNAFKFIGVAADIHMGLFDDSKYVAEVRAEFADDVGAVRDATIPGITKIRNNLNKLRREGGKATDLEEFNALVHNHRDDLARIRDAGHTLWTGMGEDFDGFRAWIKHRREELSGSLTYQLLLSTLADCESTQDLRAWMTKNAEAVETLDGNESRKFETLYDEKEAALKLLDQATVGA